MDKFVKMLIENNPTITFTCANPKCKRKVKVKTADVFSKKAYSFTCPHCKEQITVDVDQKSIEKSKTAVQALNSKHRK